MSTPVYNFVNLKCKLNEMNGLSEFSSHLPDELQELTGFIRGENLPETQVHDVPETGSSRRKIGEIEEVLVKLVVSCRR